MPPPFVQRVEIQGFGPIDSTSFALTRLHAFVGPNDAGKTSLLRALRLMGRWVYCGSDDTKAMAADLSLLAGEGGLLRAVQSDGASLTIATLGHGKPHVPPQSFVKTSLTGNDGEDLGFVVNQAGYSGNMMGRMFNRAHANATGGWTPALERLPGTNDDIEPARKHLVDSLGKPVWFPQHAALRDALYLHLDHAALRLPSPVGVERQRPLSDRGEGLAGLLDHLSDEDPQGWVDLQNEVRARLPWVERVVLKPGPTRQDPETGVSVATKEIRARLAGSGAEIPSAALSEGLFYLLAFLGLRYLDKPSIYLIEEPENGLHPARLREVMEMLREASTDTQVIIATHSPLVVNQLEPEEVSIVRRVRGQGTTVTHLVDSPTFQRHRASFSVGELWLAFVDGNEESLLFDGAEGGDPGAPLDDTRGETSAADADQSVDDSWRQADDPRPSTAHDEPDDDKR